MYNAQATLLPSFIHSAVMYIMIAVTLVYAIYKRSLKLNSFTVWYVIFLIICLVSTVFYYKSDSNILYPILVSLVISFCFILNIKSNTNIEIIANVYIFSALAMAFQIWITGQLDYLFLNSMMEEERLGSEITGNANIFSALFMYSGVFAAWQCVYSKNNSLKITNGVFLAIILLVMVISGGRKTIVSVIACLALFFFLKKDIKYRNKYFRNTIIALVSIFVIFYAIFNIPLLYNMIGARFEGLFTMFMGGGAHVGGDEMRSIIFRMAYEGWLNAPVFGYGIDSFKYYNLNETGHFYYAHNNYVELLFDIGIIGFIAYYWIFINIFKRLKRLPNSRYKFKVLGYALLMELLIYDMGGVSYYLVGSIILLAIAYKCGTLNLRTI